jgi:hypothetical protein
MFRDRNNNRKPFIKVVSDPKIVKVNVECQEACLNEKKTGKSKLLTEPKKNTKNQVEKSKKQAAKAKKQGKDNGTDKVLDEK